jgi:prepilin-type N-terminal cleavage/methylation domain-containing protein
MVLDLVRIETMRRVERAFTLIELLMVMLIIGIVIAMLMRIGPEVSRNIKVHQTQNFIHVLDLGTQRYKRIYGAFPIGISIDVYGSGTNPYHQDGPNCHPHNAAACYLYIALQGRDSYGWSRTDHGVSADFGPFLEAGATNVGEYGSWPVFIDSFNNKILYYKAQMSNKPYREAYGNGRYTVQGSSHGIWGGQREANYQNLYGRYYDHFWQKLTALRPTIDNAVRQVPHNVNSYVIWSSGADEKFGFWYYDEDELGLMADLQLGTCDDITNFD